MRLHFDFTNSLSIASTLCTALALAAIASAQTFVRSVAGPAANAQYGKACIVVPDQNGDGLKDVLVGAPGFNAERGAIYCVSGAYLALGTAPQTLWSVVPAANPGDLFGFALADVGDITGDAVHDFLVGQPGYDISTANDVGAVRLIDGSSHAILSLRWGFEQGSDFGWAIANFQPYGAVIGAPGPLAQSSSLYFVTNSGLLTSTQAGGGSFSHPASDLFGASLATVDIPGIGGRELVVGAPGATGAGGTSEAGEIVLFHTVLGNPSSIIRTYTASIAGEHLGESLDASSDYDGDGVVDILAGAPNSPGAGGSELGRVVVLSSARLANNTPPFEIGTLTPPASFTGDIHFGAAVRACGDLNGDGIGEILVGAPDLLGTFGGLSTVVKGNLSIFSGASFARWSGITGGALDHFGRAIAGTVGDLDGDGFTEFVASGTNGFDTGYIACYRLFPIPAATYCAGKQNSLGCTPSMSFSGNASANSASPFLATASNIINQKLGICFYGRVPTTAFFQGGFMCVATPIVRTPVQSSGGSTSGNDCTGTFSIDFNARIQSDIDPALVAGAEVFAQYWSRDPASPSTTSLSNALRFVINP